MREKCEERRLRVEREEERMAQKARDEKENTSRYRNSMHEDIDVSN